MERELASKLGFSVFETDGGVRVRKSATPFREAVFMLPFIVPMFVLALAGMFASLCLPISTAYAPDKYDMPLWAAIALGIMFLLGSGVAWWGLGVFITIIFSGERTIDLRNERATCNSSVWRFVYRRRTLEAPLSVVAQVYESRGAPTFRLLLQDESKRRCPLTIPTTVGSQSTAKKNALDLAFPIAREIGAEVIIEKRDSRGKRLPPEKVEIPAAS